MISGDDQVPGARAPPPILLNNWPPKPIDSSQNRPGPFPYPDFDDNDILQRPWKYIGYRGFSRVLASDRNFLVARRFDVLNARVVLSLQDQIVELESRLDEIDRKNSCKSAMDIDNGTFRNDVVEERKELTEKAYRKLKEYYEYLNSFTSVAQRPAPGHQNVSSLAFWLTDLYRSAIADPEANFIRRTDDLFAVAPKGKSPIRLMFERIKWFQVNVFRKKMPDPTYQDPTVFLQDDIAVDRFAAIVTGIMGVTFLLAPLWVLNASSGTTARLGIISGFLLLFMLLVTLGTTARSFESLAASAAYAAVLMVFLQVNGR